VSACELGILTFANSDILQEVRIELARKVYPSVLDYFFVKILAAQLLWRKLLPVGNYPPDFNVKRYD